MRVSAQTGRDLYTRSGAARWGLSADAFSLRLDASAQRRFQEAAPSAREVDTFVRSLHVEDLALAAACAAGDEGAWEHFVRELRPAIYAAARAVAASGDWQDLGDSLYAELFGLDIREGRRRSLLDYYHGRARLATWLRTVLAQRHVDRFRASARTVSMEDRADVAERADPAPVDEPRRSERVELVQRALDSAIGALDARDRLRLRLYHGEGLTLAKIGTLLGEHEATASRKLDRTRRDIRQGIARTLQAEHGLAPDAVQECLAQAAEAPEIDLSKALEQEAEDRR